MHTVHTCTAVAFGLLCMSRSAHNAMLQFLHFFFSWPIKNETSQKYMGNKQIEKECNEPTIKGFGTCFTKQEEVVKQLCYKGEM